MISTSFKRGAQFKMNKQWKKATIWVAVIALLLQLIPIGASTVYAAPDNDPQVQFEKLSDSNGNTIRLYYNDGIYYSQAQSDRGYDRLYQSTDLENWEQILTENSNGVNFIVGLHSISFIDGNVYGAGRTVPNTFDPMARRYKSFIMQMKDTRNTEDSWENFENLTGDIAYGPIATDGTNYVTVGTNFNSIYVQHTSGNGMEDKPWTQINNPTDNIRYSDVVYDSVNGRFIVAGWGGEIAISTDGGSSWTASRVDDTSDATSRYLYDILEYNGNVLVAGDNGVWVLTEEGSTKVLSGRFNQMTHDGAGTYYALTMDGTIYMSTDMNNWTLYAKIDAAEYFGGITYGHQGLLVGSSKGHYVLQRGPKITTQPNSIIVNDGEEATFSVQATGEEVTYQWQVDTTGTGDSFVDLPGETNATLTFREASAAIDGNQYRVVVTDIENRFKQSDIAQLKVRVATKIDTQPKSVTTYVGQTATFQVEASGQRDLQYQWYVSANGTDGDYVPMIGETGSVLLLENVTNTMNGNAYKVTIDGVEISSTESEQATLKLIDVSKLNPLKAQTIEGIDVTMTVPYSDSETELAYQWQVKRGSGSEYEDIANANSKTLDISDADRSMNGNEYRLIVGGELTPTYTSTAATLTVFSSDKFSLSPVSAFPGDEVVITVPIQGDEMNYQWYEMLAGEQDFTLLSNAEDRSLTLSNITSNMNGNYYRVKVDGAAAVAYTSTSALLTVLNMKDFTTKSIHTVSGQDATFSVKDVEGLTYQWQIDNGTGDFEDIDGATLATLTLSNVKNNMNGNKYRVIIGGSLQTPYISNSAQLHVTDSEKLNPRSKITLANETVTLSVPEPLDDYSYQWQMDTTGTGESFVPIKGETSSQLVIEAAAKTTENDIYRVVIGGPFQEAYITSSSKLTIYEKKDLQPESVQAPVGTDAEFIVTSNEALTYQWQINKGKGFEDLEGQTEYRLLLEDVYLPQNGWKVRVKVSGGLERQFISEEANLEVATSPGAPTNVRASAGNGSVTIYFDEPTDKGGTAPLQYTVTILPENRTVTGTESPVKISDLKNGTAYTFTVTASNFAGESTSEASKEIRPYAPSTTETVQNHVQEAVVIVDGKAEYLGKSTTTVDKGKIATEVEIDSAKLSEKLKDLDEGAIITIPDTAESEELTVKLKGDSIAQLQEKKSKLKVSTDTASYTLPANEIDLEDVLDEFNNDSKQEDLSINITIAQPTDIELELLNEAIAVHHGATLVGEPAHFDITAQSGNDYIQIHQFRDYVERSFVILEELDSHHVTTGIVYHPSGELAPVPTVIMDADGQQHAIINSLTNSLYALISYPVEFVDVQDHWAKEQINNMGSRLIVNGTGNDLYEPASSVTRAEFASIVVRALGLRASASELPFNDVSTDSWYFNAVTAAYAYGLVEGDREGNFNGSDTVTREQAMSIIARAMSITGLAASTDAFNVNLLLSSFADYNQIASWSQESFAQVLQAGLLTGRTDNRLAPKAVLTRAEAAVLVQRLLQRSNLI